MEGAPMERVSVDSMRYWQNELQTGSTLRSNSALDSLNISLYEPPKTPPAPENSSSKPAPFSTAPVVQSPPVAPARSFATQYKKRMFKCIYELESLPPSLSPSCLFAFFLSFQ